MHMVTTIGLDIAKSALQVHGVDAAGQVVMRRQLKRRFVLSFFENCRRAWWTSKLARHPIIGPASCRRRNIKRRTCRSQAASTSVGALITDPPGPRS
jgi:transposase